MMDPNPNLTETSPPDFEIEPFRLLLGPPSPRCTDSFELSAQTSILSLVNTPEPPPPLENVTPKSLNPFEDPRWQQYTTELPPQDEFLNYMDNLTAPVVNSSMQNFALGGSTAKVPRMDNNDSGFTRSSGTFLGNPRFSAKCGCDGFELPYFPLIQYLMESLLKAGDEEFVRTLTMALNQVEKCAPCQCRTCKEYLPGIHFPDPGKLTDCPNILRFIGFKTAKRLIPNGIPGPRGGCKLGLVQKNAATPTATPVLIASQNQMPSTSSGGRSKTAKSVNPENVREAEKLINWLKSTFVPLPSSRLELGQIYLWYANAALGKAHPLSKEILLKCIARLFGGVCETKHVYCGDQKFVFFKGIGHKEVLHQLENRNGKFVKRSKRREEK